MVHPNDITCRKGGNLEMDPIIKRNQGKGGQLEYFLQKSSGNVFWSIILEVSCGNK